MTEYELVRARAEAEAVDCGAMTAANMEHGRRNGVQVCASVNLTPERVWELTRGIRTEGDAK